MSAELSITTLLLASKVRITPIVTNEPSSSLEKVTAIVNDSTSTNPITEIDITFLDENDVRLSFYELNSTQLPLGVGTFIQLRYFYNDKTILNSGIELVTLGAVPQPVNLVLNSNIRQEDQFLSFKLGITHSVDSLSDGYSRITKMIVYTSKVGATASTDFRRDEITVSSDSDYSEWSAVGFANDQGLLANETGYEVAVQLVNSYGLSAMSNTIIATPKNTPNTIGNVLLRTLLAYQRDLSLQEEDSRGDVVIQWSKPSDFNQLINSSLGVTKYYIYKQLMVQNSSNQWVPSGDRVEIPLDVPYTEPGALQQDGTTRDPPVVNEPTYAHVATVNGVSYDYRYTVEGSPSDLGKRFDYSVVSENVNGVSPESTPQHIITFTTPDSQPYTLVHHKTTSSVTGASITIYDGKVSLKIDDLSSINGGTESSSDGDSGDKTVEGSVAPGIPIKNYNMRLVVKDITNSTNPLPVMDSDILFVQQTEVVDGIVAGTKVQQTLDEWVFSLDDAVVENTATTINQYLAGNYGNKLQYELHRISLNPNDITSRYEAVAVVFQRTSFRSPERVSKIGVYSFNDDLSPVKKNGSPAVRLVFNQLTDLEMNGLANFTGPKVYYPHKDSFPISGASINHVDGNTNEVEYIVDMATEGLGVNANVYLRVKVFNDELGLDIDSSESSPVIVEVARDYPQAVTGLIVSPESSDSSKINISWTKQPASIIARGGFSVDDLQNRVVVIQDGVSSLSPIHSSVIAHNNATQSIQVASLNAGESYKVYVIAEGKYTKANLDPAGNRFLDAFVSNNVANRSLVLTGSPNAPILEGNYSSDQKFTILYDQPTALNGVPASSIVYHFYMNKEDTANFPYFTENNTLLQTAVATATVTSSVTISQAFTTEADSSDILNLVNLENDVPYYFSMLAKASIGNIPLQTNTDPYTYTTQIINGNNFDRTLNLQSDLLIPVREVVGGATTKEVVVPGNGVPSPEFELTSGENLVTVSIQKHSGAGITDLDIVVDNNDGLDKDGSPVPGFNTISATYNTYTGLFALEQAYAADALHTVFDSAGKSFGSVVVNNVETGWNFRRIVTETGVTRYLIDFNNLTNGDLFNFGVRFGKTSGQRTVYGEVVVREAAAEAPPSIVLNSYFRVDSNRIIVNWSAPENSGGAGVQNNGPLHYKVMLLSSSNVILATHEKTASELTTEFPNLSNYTSANQITYSVQILAFYINAKEQLVEGFAVSPRPYNNVTVTGQITNLALSIQIRVNPAPINSTLDLTAGDHQVTGTITTPPTSTTQLYRMEAYQILIKRKDAAADVDPEEKQRLLDSNVVIGAGSGNGFNSNAVTDINAIVSLLNGLPYIISVRAVPTYNYAQGPDDESYEVSPLGNLAILNATVVSGSNNKNMLVQFNANGSGNASTIVALAKASSSTAIVVKNLSSSSDTLPNIVYSGAEDASVAANQTGSFTLSFAELSDPGVNDLLVVVGNGYSTDTFVFPTTGDQFFA